VSPEIVPILLGGGRSASQSHGRRVDDRTGGAEDSDRRVAAELAKLSNADADYWTFRRGVLRGGAHGFTQYPAMMVPPMQAALLGVVLKVDHRIRSVIDPFCGAGTTLVECMRLGLNYAGQDVNPLAVLLCRAKAGPFHVHRLASAADVVVARAAIDRSMSLKAEFPGLAKWFMPEVAVELSRIRRAIRREKNQWCRRVLWVALAETVRLSSNSRTSTFKLHTRSAEDLKTRRVNVLATFKDVLSDLVARLQHEATALREAGHLTQGGCYKGYIHLCLGDSTTHLLRATTKAHDLLITSPPYGDNTSTVPYGQYSYLPLQWIDLCDIDESATPVDLLASTYEIDSRSLGGSRKRVLHKLGQLLPRAPTLAKTLSHLEDQPIDRRSRVAAFCRDLDSCVATALLALRRNAYMIWTVGNRRVGGRTVPTDVILSEILQGRGARPVATIERRIPNKRMATRNNIAATMRGESTLVFRKE
jgi:hypothetical protein